MRSLILFSVVAMLGGCAAPSLYRWGDYSGSLYAGYKDPSKMEAMRIRLEDHITAMEGIQEKIAPGLYAELGTLYLQSGTIEKASSYYAKERAVWPESNVLMTAMIRNLERQKQEKNQDKANE